MLLNKGIIFYTALYHIVLPPNHSSVSRRSLKALVLLFPQSDVNTMTVELGNVGLGVISV